MAITVLYLIPYILATILVGSFGLVVCFMGYLYHIHKIFTRTTSFKLHTGSSSGHSEIQSDNWEIEI